MEPCPLWMPHHRGERDDEEQGELHEHILVEHAVLKLRADAAYVGVARQVLNGVGPVAPWPKHRYEPTRMQPSAERGLGQPAALELGLTTATFEHTRLYQEPRLLISGLWL